MSKININKAMEEFESERDLFNNNHSKEVQNSTKIKTNNVIYSTNGWYMPHFNPSNFNFSNVDEKFLDKNKKFLEVLFDKREYKILTNNEKVDYYSLIQVVSDSESHIIPVPVLRDIFGFDENYSDEVEYNEYFLNEINKIYWFKVSDREEREWEWQSDYEEEEWELDNYLDNYNVLPDLNIDSFKEQLLKAPYYEFKDGSMWVYEEYAKFYIITNTWESIELDQAENKSSNYAYSPRYEKTAKLAISQIIDFIDENGENSIEEITLNTFIKDTFVDYDYKNNNRKFKVKLSDVIDFINDYRDIKIKQESIEYEENLNTLKDFLDKTPEIKEYRSDVWDFIYEKTIMIIDENDNITNLKQDGKTGYGYAYHKPLIYEGAESVRNQLKKIISEKWENFIKSLIYKNYQKSDYSLNFENIFEIKFEDIKEFI